MGRPVVRWEPMSKDPAKLSAFYQNTFDWKIEQRPEMSYRFVDIDAEGGIDGGILNPQRTGPWPGNTVLYVDVDDLADYRERIAAAGGKIHVEAQEITGVGTLCPFTDPDGRMMGLWKQA